MRSVAASPLDACAAIFQITTKTTSTNGAAFFCSQESHESRR